MSPILVSTFVLYLLVLALKRAHQPLQYRALKLPLETHEAKMYPQPPSYNVFPERLGPGNGAPCIVCNPDPAVETTQQTAHPMCLYRLVLPKVADAPRPIEATQAGYVPGMADHIDGDSSKQEDTQGPPDEPCQKFASPAKGAHVLAVVPMKCNSCRRLRVDFEPGLRKCNKCRTQAKKNREKHKARGICNCCSGPIGVSRSIVSCQACVDRRNVRRRRG